MAMTKKDYELVAQSIYFARYMGEGAKTKEWQDALDRATIYLAEGFARSNPRFNGGLFLSKCNYGKRPRVSEVA
jgi:hypothetical protein